MEMPASLPDGSTSTLGITDLLVHRFYSVIGQLNDIFKDNNGTDDSDDIESRNNKNDWHYIIT